jgi:hypothetical protein
MFSVPGPAALTLEGLIVLRSAGARRNEAGVWGAAIMFSVPGPAALTLEGLIVLRSAGARRNEAGVWGAAAPWEESYLKGLSKGILKGFVLTWLQSGWKLKCTF